MGAGAGAGLLPVPVLVLVLVLVLVYDEQGPRVGAGRGEDKRDKEMAESKVGVERETCEERED